MNQQSFHKNMFSLEAEQSCLGAMLQSFNAISAVREILKDDDFFDSRNKMVFKTIVELNEKHIPIDSVSVSERLNSEGQLQQAGGASYISKLIENVPSISNVQYYANIVLDKSKKRDLRNALNACMDDLSENIPLQDVLHDIQNKTMGLLETNGRDAVKTFAQISQETMKHLEQVSKNKGYTGIPCGFKDIDRRTGGFQKGEVVIIAGPPSMGKSQFGFQIGINMAKKKQNVLIFALEMSGRQIFSRMLSNESMIGHFKIRNAWMNDAEFAEIVDTSSKLAQLPIYIDDSANSAIEHIVNETRIFKMKNKVDVVIVDHLQLVSIKERHNNRNEELDLITRRMKAMAKTMNIPVICLSQLSRESGKRPDKRPVLTDIRESGAIEQNADIVMGIYRDDYYHKESDKRGIAEIITLKFRDGSTGTDELVFMPDVVKFADIARVDGGRHE